MTEEKKTYRAHRLFGVLFGFDGHSWGLIQSGNGTYVRGGGEAYYHVYICTVCGKLKKEVV